MKIEGTGRNFKGGGIPNKENFVSPNISAKANSSFNSTNPDKISSTLRPERATYDLKLSKAKQKSLDLRIEKVEEIKQKVSSGYYQQPATMEQVASKILKLWGMGENPTKK